MNLLSAARFANIKKEKINTVKEVCAKKLSWKQLKMMMTLAELDNAISSPALSNTSDLRSCHTNLVQK